MLSFIGKTVIVTGGNKGIGLGITKAFAEAGANVGVISRHVGKAESVIQKINDSGRKAHFFYGDVISLQSIKEAVKNVVDFFGNIDIVCSNAGIFPTTSLENMSVADWDTVMNTNARGTFFVIQASLPYLKQFNQGRIIITSSITGPITGYSGFSHYGASKAAQLGFMRSAALELAPYQITINAVLPGNIRTEGLTDLGEEYLRKMAASVPLKRLGTPDDIAEAVLFLASKGAGYITGQTIVVDGGQTLPENIDAL